MVRSWLLFQQPGVPPCPGKGEQGTLRRPEPEQDGQVSDGRSWHPETSESDGHGARLVWSHMSQRV